MQLDSAEGEEGEHPSAAARRPQPRWSRCSLSCQSPQSRWRDVDCTHKVSVLHLDDPSLQLRVCVPHAVVPHTIHLLALGPFPFAFLPLDHLQLAIIESHGSSRCKNALRQGGKRLHHRLQQPLLLGLPELSALYDHWARELLSTGLRRRHRGSLIVRTGWFQSIKERGVLVHSWYAVSTSQFKTRFFRQLRPRALGANAYSDPDRVTRPSGNIG